MNSTFEMCFIPYGLFILKVEGGNIMEQKKIGLFVASCRKA